jgi:hypothetical protein
LSGHILLSPGVHNLSLSITDAYGNISNVNGKIVCELPNSKTLQKPRSWVRQKSWQINSFLDSDLQILNSENGVFIEFQDIENLFAVHGRLIINDNKPFNFDFFHTPPQTYYSTLIPFEKFKNINHILVLTKEKHVEFPVNAMVVYPNSQSKVSSKDNIVDIQFAEFALFDTALIWIKNTHSFKEKDIKPLTNTYNIEPSNLPLKNSVYLTFKLNQNQQLIDGIGIYRYNKKKNKWEFQEPHGKNFIQHTVELSELGIFTLLQDTIPPEIVYISPAPSQSYTSGDIYSIECVLKDNLSGVEPSEDALKFILNGKRIFCAYQPVKKELSYSFIDPLITGNYSMYISARDYAGNKMEKTIIFNVN